MDNWSGSYGMSYSVVIVEETNYLNIYDSILNI